MQQASRAASHRRPGGTKPRRRASTAPINGQVTREDLERLYAEFTAESRRALRAGELHEPPTLAEYQRYLVGALIDPPPRRPIRPSARRNMAAAQRRRRERERAIQDRLAQLTVRDELAA